MCKVDAELKAAVEHMEGLLWGYDWLGTGSSIRQANAEEREAWERWNVIRNALGLGDYKDD